MTRTNDDFRWMISDFNTAPSVSPKSKIKNQKSKMACLLLTLTLALGCGDQSALTPNSTPTPAASSSPAKDDHGHKHAGHGAGPHEGAVADWGGGKFHVEFTVDHDKQEATVYVLGSDEKTAAPVKTDKLLLTVNAPKFQVELAAAPLEGEAEGTASRFVGKHESLGKMQEFAGTISGEVEGTPYAGDFLQGRAARGSQVRVAATRDFFKLTHYRSAKGTSTSSCVGSLANNDWRRRFCYACAARTQYRRTS